MPPRALTWIAPGHEVDALTREPATCLALGGDPAQIEAGRALFNAPQLLGGQAARAEISCASCHSNGRSNPHFLLAGVSDGPGTADVSASFFSPARGNGRFDPKPIPDLAMPGQIARDPAGGEMERFLRGLVVEEFAGQEPSASTLAALSAYVRAIRPCDDRTYQTRALSGQLQLIRASVRGAAWFGGQGETEAGLLLLRGARHQLGLVDERYPGMNSVHRRLLAASRELQALHDSADLSRSALDRWLGRFERRTTPLLLRLEPQSLYRPDRVSSVFAASAMAATKPSGSSSWMK